jgi:hypothetical protein
MHFMYSNFLLKKYSFKIIEIIKVIGGCLTSGCRNGGLCDQNTGKCSCQSIYTGEQCQTCK